MNIGNFDPSSLLLLFLGKDNSWIPLVFILILVMQKWEKIVDAYHRLTVFGKTQYTVSGTIYTNINDNHTYGQLGTTMWALLLYINNIVKSDKNLLSTAKHIKFPHNRVFDTDDIVVIPSSNSNFPLTTDINCELIIDSQKREMNDNDNNKSSNIDCTTLTITLITTQQLSVIVSFIDSIIKSYRQTIENKNKINQYIIKPKFGKENENPAESDLDYAKHIPFATTKSFDNLFFDGKDELIKRLNSFIRRDKYKVLGLPETLGLLFYGEPGTGKTSCIKAIAKYLDMSLIIVPMSHIKTKKRLEELFFSGEIDIPQEKRIYVFEEIDCNGWDDIVRDRALIAAEKAAADGEQKSEVLLEKLAETLVVSGSGTEGGDKSFKKDNKDKLTLGGILEIIDGLVECPGRVIIMTTNCKEHVDSALLRPGRIDMSLEFKKLRGEHIAEIYKKWYGADMAAHRIEDITDYKYTQAEVSQLLFKYEDDQRGFIQEIGCS
jgi:hypothetical protein